MPVGDSSLVYQLHLRAEAFNVFNRPQWGLAISNFNSASSFGTTTSVLNSGTTGTNRKLQFAARLNFQPIRRPPGHQQVGLLLICASQGDVLREA